MSRVPRPRDLDLDPAAGGRMPPAYGPEQWYVRLVANPFLALALIFVGVCVIRSRLFGVRGTGDDGALRILMTVAFGAGLLFVVLRTLHYHCLDCGATGRLSRWREHLCPTVAERRLSGRARRLHGPTPGVQLLIMACSFGLLVAIVLGYLRAQG